MNQAGERRGKGVRMPILIFLVLILPIVSCASEAGFKRVVHQDADLLVILDRREIPTSPSIEPVYDHPSSISPAVLQRTLEAIRVQQEPGLLMRLIAGKAEERPLADPAAVALLAVKLSNALAEAGPQERVDFYQVSPRDAVTRSVSSGTVFVKDHMLHLRLDHFRAPLEKDEPPTAVNQASGRPDEKKETAFALVEGPQLVHRRYKNWVGISESDPRWLIADYAVLAAETLRSGGGAAVEAPTLPPPPLNPSPEGGLEEKLRTLKHLRDEGLISEQEYIDKKRALLKGF